MVIVLGAVALLVAANRPGIPAVLWTTVAVLVVLAVLEVFVRADGRRSADRVSTVPGRGRQSPAYLWMLGGIIVLYAAIIGFGRRARRRAAAGDRAGATWCGTRPGCARATASGGSRW